jgi:hypothetical protein
MANLNHNIHINDIHNISLDSIYSCNDEYSQNNNNKEMNENLINPYSENNFCDKFCLWWFFNSGTGLEKQQICYISSSECICCSCCSLIYQIKLNINICSIKSCECCCISCFYE